jgi:hypothetical protein
MKAILYFTTSIKNELLKLKRTFAFWLVIVSAFFIPFIFLMVYLFKTELFIPKAGVNPWDDYIGQQVKSIIPFLLPMFIILITSLIIQVEHKSNAIKHIFTLPVPKWSIYFGKLTVVIVSVFFSFVLFYIIMLSFGYLAGVIQPELKLTEFSPKYTLSIKIIFRAIISVFAMIGLQFWLSFRIKNFIIPLGVGMVLMVTGLNLYKGAESIYFPYAYNMLSLFPKGGLMENLVWFPKVSFYSMGYFLLFSILGYIDVSRKNIK